MRLWAFGDSFTEPFHKQTAGQLEYHKWKGYIPKNFLDFLSEKLNTPQFNLGKGGSSNRTILSSIISNLDNFLDNDIVIIGWTSLNRYRTIGYNEDFFDIVGPNVTSEHWFDFPNMDSTLNEFLLIREHPKFLEELMEYMVLINKVLKNCKVFHWTWHPINKPSWTPKIQKIIDLYYSKLVHVGPIEDIYTETQGVIKDFHYSENAHKKLSDKFLEKIS